MDLVIVGLGPHGRQHGAPPAPRRPSRRGLQPLAREDPRDHGRGLEGAFSPEEAVATLPSPRIVWLMVPAGDATEATMEEFAALLRAGRHDRRRRQHQLPGLQAPPRAARGARHPLRGCRHLAAASGASRTATARWSAATARRSRRWSPSSGRWRPRAATSTAGRRAPGHYTKMVHNGIEYGLMQAYAEGFEILHASEYPLDLAAVAKAWQHGTVIRSWLLELAGLAFEQHGEDLRRHQGLGRRLRRGPLDGPGGDGPRRAGAGHHALAAGPLPQPPGRELRRQGARGAAPAVRRPRRQERVSAAAVPRRARAPATRRGRRVGHARDAARRRAPPAHRRATATCTWSTASRRRRERRQPAAHRHPPRAHPRPLPGGHLRRHRRPRPPQDPARPLQPAPGRPAAARDERRGLRAPALHRRRLPRGDARVGGAALAQPGRAGAVGRLRGRHPLPAGRVRRPRQLPGARRAAGADRRGRRHARQRPLLPRHAALRLPGDRGQPGRGGPPAAARPAGARIVIEKPFGHDLASARALNDDGHARLRRVAGLPHRPLPGQGHRPQPAGVPLRQRHLRAALEPALRRPRADHRGRGPRRRGPRRVLRGGRAPAATSSRTTCSSCSAWWPWSRPSPSRPTRCATRRCACCAPSTPTGPRRGSRANVVRGQYTAGWVADQKVAGYREEPEVAPDARRSRRSWRCELEIQNWRWADVPFYLRTGKRLPRRATEIAVQFKQPPLMLFRDSRERRPSRTCWRCASSPTRASCCASRPRCPELGLDVRSVNMDFTYGSSFLRDAPEAYETLILDAMLGDASLFTRADEVEAAWGIVTPLHEHVAALGRRGTKGEKASGAAADGGIQPYEAGHLGAGRRRPADGARRPAMAPPVDARPSRASTDATARPAGTLHATSLSETVAQLSRIWGGAGARQRRSRCVRRAGRVACARTRACAPAPMRPGRACACAPGPAC